MHLSVTFVHRVVKTFLWWSSVPFKQMLLVGSGNAHHGNYSDFYILRPLERLTNRPSFLLVEINRVTGDQTVLACRGVATCTQGTQSLMIYLEKRRENRVHIAEGHNGVNRQPSKLPPHWDPHSNLGYCLGSRRSSEHRDSVANSGKKTLICK